mgnify:CR=1 FL=1
MIGLKETMRNVPVVGTERYIEMNNDHKHKIKLWKRQYPENLYECKNCGNIWSARNIKHLTGGSHLGFESESPCQAVTVRIGVSFN